MFYVLIHSISEEDVKKHPRFFVNCNSCSRSYTKWNSYLQRGCRSVTLERSNTNSTNNKQKIDESYLVSNGVGGTNESFSEPKEEQDDQ